MSKRDLFIAACAIALILLVGVTGAVTPTPTSVTQYHYLTRWGCPGTGDGQFDMASDIAVDGAGNVFVAEGTVMYEDGPHGNKRIQKFTPDGTFITKWATNGGSSLDVDRAGRVYLTEGGMIKRYTSNGTLISMWGPYGSGLDLGPIAVDGTGTVYVLSPETDSVLKIDANGTLVKIWTTPGEYSSPWDIDVDGTGIVYVVDIEYGIRKFTPEGAYITTIQSYYASHIAFDAAGDFWLKHKYGVTKFTSTGVIITNLPGEGLGNLGAITVDGAGNVYGIWGGVMKWAPGAPTPTPTPTPRPQQQYHFVLKWGTEGVLPGAFSAPEGIAEDGAGHLYVADTNNHRVQKFTSGGEFLMTWGDPGTGDGLFDGLSAISVDGTGNVYVADTWNHRVQKFTSNGTFITKWGIEGSGDGEFEYPYGIAVDGAGNVYVADTGNNRVQKFSANGTFTGKWGSGGDCELRLVYPTDIAIDPAGTVYVADTRGLRGYTPDGAFVSRIAGLPDSRGIEVDEDGRLFVISQDEVMVYSSAGTLATAWGGRGTGDGQFDNPGSVAVDGGGNVYVADTRNNRIQKFSPGAPTPTPTPTSGPYRPLSIPGRVEAEDYNTGGEGVAYHDTTKGNAGGMYRTDDVDIERFTAEGSPSVGWIRNGEWLTYTANVTTAGTYTMKAHVASPNSGRTIALAIDSTTKATIAVPNTGSFANFTTVTVPVTLTAGTHTLRLTFSGDGQNLDWLEFGAGGTTTPTPTPTAGPYRPLSIPGRIEAEDYDLGGAGIAYHDTTAGNAGGVYRTDDVDIERFTAEGSPSIGWIRNGEWLTYTATVTTPGAYTMRARVANPNLPRTAALSVDGVQAATITVPTTGSYGRFTTVQAPVMLPAGTHMLRLSFSGDGQNWNWLEFATGTVTIPIPTPPPGAGASFVAVPTTVPHGSAVRFTVTPAAGKTIRSAWWSFDSVGHYSTWNSRNLNPTFYFPSAGTFSPLVRLTYTDGSSETVARANYIRAT